VSRKPSKKRRIRKGRKISVLMMMKFSGGYVTCSESNLRRRRRLPIAVSVCVIILVGGNKYFIVLNAVEGMVERQNLDSGLRDQLQGTEAHVHHLEAELADALLNKDIVPIITHTSMLGDSDTGA
jgi:hypothetical protein